MRYKLPKKLLSEIDSVMHIQLSEPSVKTNEYMRVLAKRPPNQITKDKMKKYQIIYADPPWSYKVWSKKGLGRSAESHYKTMNKQDIQALRVPSDKDCTLFLWVTAPCLIEGIELCTAWGFEYKTIGFCWCKRNKVSPSWFWGMGYWTRANVELCLIATKGHPKRLAKNVHQIIDTPIERHSKKPDCTRDRIVKLMGDLPRLELFARQKTEGWDVWGNEVNSDITLWGDKNGKESQ